MGVVSGWTLGLSLIGLTPWPPAALYTLAMGLVLLLSWRLREHLAVQALLLIFSFAAPALLAGLHSPEALVFGLGMLVPLAIVLVVVLLTAGSSRGQRGC